MEIEYSGTENKQEINIAEGCVKTGTQQINPCNSMWIILSLKSQTESVPGLTAADTTAKIFSFI